MKVRMFFAYLMLFVGYLLAIIGGGCALMNLFIFPTLLAVTVPAALIGVAFIHFAKKLRDIPRPEEDLSTWD